MSLRGLSLGDDANPPLLMVVVLEEHREWLHVDFDDHLKAMYFDACGFTPTNAGLIEL